MGNKFINKISSLLFYISILTFFIAFNFAHNPPGGWYQQFLPDLNNRPLADIQFIDSLLGYGITGDHTSGDTNYIIKTTNGGDNWFIINSVYNDLSRVKFLNANTGYICGGGSGFFIKTTNGGTNWTDVNSSLTGYIEDIFVLNEDTIWYTDTRVVIGGLFRTTDGGATWIRQFYASGNIPSRIYMLNAHVGFFSNSFYLNKTTNSGFNWTTISGENGFQDIYFADSLTGWKSNGDMKKTTDGGLSWISQNLPVTSNVGISKFTNVNNDTIFGVGGEIFYPGNGSRGIIYKTTNGGINWGYQLPDTSFNIGIYYHIGSINKLNVWCYFNFTGVHTTIGGDTTYYPTSVTQISGTTPSDYKLFQNYPNPFNPVTKIKYELKTPGFIKLNVYNINGKEVKTIVNEKQNTGVYEADFSATEYGSSLSSGVYFYSLFAGEELVDTKKMVVLK